MLSSTLHTLLQGPIDSFEKLRLVIELRRAPGRMRTIAALARSLDITRDEVRKLARGLSANGLACTVLTDTIVLMMQDAATEDALRDLDLLYERDRPALAVAIAEGAMDRLRDLVFRVLGRRSANDDSSSAS